MGFKANMSNSLNNKTILENQNSQELLKINLDLEETGYILGSMKSSTFRGDQLEKVFNLVMKLQKHYTNIKKND